MTLGEEWIGTLVAARDPVDGWIEKVAPHGWLVHSHGQGTRKDLLGHLTAWPDFLLDQVEALRENRPDAIEAIEVDAWNAVEVERRRNWTVEAIVAAYGREMYEGVENGLTLWRDASAAGQVGRGRIIARKPL